MKVIKINAEDQTVTEAVIPNGFENLYSAIGKGCNSYECIINYENGDGLYVDEEAMLKLNALDEIKYAFSVEGNAGLYMGNAVIVGHDKNGDTVSYETSIEQIQKKMQFYTVILHLKNKNK